MACKAWLLSAGLNLPAKKTGVADLPPSHHPGPERTAYRRSRCCTHPAGRVHMKAYWREPRLVTIDHPGQYVTVAEASQRLGMTPAGVRYALRTRHIPHLTINGRVLLIEQRYLTRLCRQRRGRRPRGGERR